LGVELGGEGSNLRGRMNDRPPSSRRHTHKVVTVHALEQRSGVPYEVERRMCSACRRVLDERPLRRTAA
jgi:hypothetical protein